MARRRLPPPGPVTIWDFVDEFLVVCPRCSGCAVVRAGTSSRPARCTCSSCGHSQVSKVASRDVLFSRSASGWPEGQFAIGDAADAYFHLPLWLQVPCLGHTLWAYNERHVAFLRDYVAATDRRSPHRSASDPLNTLLASRLPKWMQLAKHRPAVLRELSKLEDKAREASCAGGSSRKSSVGPGSG